MDPETGLYYFGARYYDSRLSRWISADPPLATGEYLPSRNSRLPGGGVYNPLNLNVYQYTYNNPIIYNYPDGNVPFLVIWLGKGAVEGQQMSHLMQLWLNILERSILGKME